MDLSPVLDPRVPPPSDGSSPTQQSHIQPPSPPTSNAQLASLLSEAFREAESLRRELRSTLKRADKAERTVQVLTANPDPAGSPSASTNTNGSPQQQQQQQQELERAKHAQAMKRLVDEYEERLGQLEMAREEAEGRRRVAQDGWDQLERYLTVLEIRSKDARTAFSRLADGASGSLVLPPVPRDPSSHQQPPQTMAPPHVPARQHSRSHHHQQPSQSQQRHTAGGVFPSLPPHPNPNPIPNPAPSAGARRPRTPSIDGLYSAAQPPSKRSRANTDDQRGREPRVSYSESYVPTVQQQQQQIQHPADRDFHEQQLRHQQRQQAQAQQQQQQQQQQLMQTQQQRLEPRVLKYGSGHHAHGGGHGHAHHGQQHHSHRPNSRSHSRSGSHSSQSSLDVDEMLLRATTGDEHAGGGAGTPNGSGTPYVDSPHHHHLGRSSTMPHRRSRGDRDGESPRPQSNANGPHPGITTATNPYPPQHPSNAAYPANQSAPAQPAMSSLRGPGGAGQQAGGEGRPGQVIQTHIFAPVVTGAPIKKPKFPNTIGVGSASLGGSGPSLETPPGPGSITTAGAPAPAPTAVPFASTNAQGQRICRQCGMVGRYKDGKCVEKWGPGPMGPGTVCDRCRKKMKRVERRGTLENQQQQLAVQQQQHQPRSSAHAEPPLSQGSERSIHRSDTILAHQASHGPSGFAQSTSRSEREVATHLQSTMRTAHSSPAVKRHLSPPPSIAALDDDEQEHDPDQLPISNIGRGAPGLRSAGQSRSNSRNGRVRGGAGARPTPPASDMGNPNGVPAKRSPLGGAVGSGSSSGGARGVRGSTSPQMGMDVDETDADADADAEAEAEAEILGAVEAAGDMEVEGDGDGDGELEGDGDGDGDADADAELLEAVDAAEANSNSSSHGGERAWMKAEPV